LLIPGNVAAETLTDGNLCDVGPGHERGQGWDGS
jgi:hypothetical protein